MSEMNKERNRMEKVQCPSCGSFSTMDDGEGGAECFNCGINFALPKLPEGYEVIGQELYFDNELIAEYDPKFIPNVGLIFYGGCENGEACMDVKHAPALATFLQGLR